MKEQEIELCELMDGFAFDESHAVIRISLDFITDGLSTWAELMLLFDAVDALELPSLKQCIQVDAIDKWGSWEEYCDQNFISQERS